MNDNIQIVNKNGDMMYVEGISFIEITPTNKKYLFYTLNEKVDNDLNKIYIAEASTGEETLNPISDTEWDEIRKKMVKISHKEELADIKYMAFGENIFHVGDAKKLAVTAVAKQAFKDAQATHTISTNQSETPVVSGGTFIQESAPVSDGTSVQAETNIFENPPAPTESVAESVPNLVENQVVAESPVQVEQVVENAPLPAEPETIVAPAAEIPDKTTTPASEESSSGSKTPESVADQVETEEQREIISDEDALKAISVIQDYIAQEEAA